LPLHLPFIKKLHPQAFVDQFCGRYFVEELPEKIMNNVLHCKDKIVHISKSNPRSLYQHYVDKGLQVEPIEIPLEITHLIPKNINLINTSKW